MNKKHLIILLIVVAVSLIVGVLGIVLFLVKPKPIIEYKETTTTDTITIERVDTLRITQIKDPVTITKERVDTIYQDVILRDTVANMPIEIPIETKVYQDSLYRVEIEGYNAVLKSIEIYPHHTTTTITNSTTIEQTKQKNKGISFGPTVGFGYGIFSKQPDLFIGFGLTYRF